jgi:alkanesulfonate monooxygenase SsuD/methylene tetrahydromethanopterin reductase-like flavin-dependent oxidoreductase (luciferase family)
MEIPTRDIIPKPLQSPHPPLFMACTKEATLNLAGRLGVGALALGFSGPDDIAEKNRVYRAAVARRTPEHVVGKFAVNHLSALCPTIVLDDAAEAREIGFRGQRFFGESLNQWARGTPPPDPATYGSDSERVLTEARTRLEMKFGSELVTIANETDRRDAEQKVGIALTRADQAYGSVANCIDYVDRLIEAGADEIMFLVQMGTVPQQVCLETIHKLGTEVIPHFRRAEG